MPRARRKLIPLPNSKRWMLRPPLMSRGASRRRNRAQAATISALAVEQLRAWKDRRRPSVSRSPNGIALRKHRHSSSQRPGPISVRIVTRRSRPYADMRWKNGTNKFHRVRLALKTEAASIGGLFQFVRLRHIADIATAAAFVRYWSNSGQRWILACGGLSAYDPKRSR